MKCSTPREIQACRRLGARASAWLPLVFMLCMAAASIGADRPLQIGSKEFTEGMILGEIATKLSNAQGVPANHRSALGGTQIVFAALEKGEIDAYADYTGTIALQILREGDPANEEELRALLKDRGIGMTGRLGFNNTYALGMREEVAKRLGIRKISDLAAPDHAGLRFAFSAEFISRPDGWPGLRQKYGLPQRATGMDHNVAYTGLMSGSADLTDIYSTDAEIRIFDLRVLEDDRGYFPNYSAVYLYRLDLADRSPKFIEVLESLAGTIDDERMLAMNTKVRGSNGRISEAMVAAEFVNERFGTNISVAPTPWYVDLLRNTRDHLRLVLESLALAVVIAVPLGIFAHKWPKVGQGILGAVGIMQTLPSMAVLVFMVPLMGLGPRPAILALFLYSLLPIVRNTYQGLTGIPANLRESAEVLGLPPWARLWRVELPLASPSILAGIKTAAVINVGTATIGALIGAGGYGQPILTGLRLSDPNLLLLGAVPAAVMAVLAQFAFDALEPWVVPKGLRLK